MWTPPCSSAIICKLVALRCGTDVLGSKIIESWKLIQIMAFYDCVFASVFYFVLLSLKWQFCTEIFYKKCKFKATLCFVSVVNRLQSRNIADCILQFRYYRFVELIVSVCFSFVCCSNLIL